MKEYIERIQNGKSNVMFQKNGNVNTNWNTMKSFTCFDLITQALISGNGSVNDLWYMSKLVDREKERLGEKIDPDLLKIGRICKELIGEDNIEKYGDTAYNTGHSRPAKDLGEEKTVSHLCNAMIQEGKVVITDTVKYHLTEAVMNFNKNNSSEKKHKLEERFDEMLKGASYTINWNQHNTVGTGGVKGVWYLIHAHDEGIQQVHNARWGDKLYKYSPENPDNYKFLDGKELEDSYNTLMKRIEENNYKAIRDMAGGIKQLSDQWNAQKSHTISSLFDSKEYTGMEKAFKNFIGAFDKVVAGESITNGAAEEGRLRDQDLKKLFLLQKEMQDKADAYIEAKRIQKGGDLSAHSTEQGKDRLAMADILSEFRMDNLMMEYVAKEKAAQKQQKQPVNNNEAQKQNDKAPIINEDKASVTRRAVKLGELLDQEKSTRKSNARDELNKRREYLMKQRADGTKVSDSRVKGK